MKNPVDPAELKTAIENVSASESFRVAQGISKLALRRNVNG